VTAVGQIEHTTRTASVTSRPRSVLVTLCLLVHGCANVDGGAVELSWKLRPTSGSPNNFLACDGSGRVLDSTGAPLVDAGAMTFIRLHWTIGQIVGSRAFSCSTNHGVTRFELPQGNALLSITPLCTNLDTLQICEAPTSTYIAPAPEQRQVIVGDVVSLGALELLLDPSYATKPCGSDATSCQ
jgi:hypothetical protein